LDEETCLKKLTTYGAFTMRKAAPPNSAENLSWARAEITEERFPQEIMVRQIQKLDGNKRTAIERKTALKPFQQGQINNLVQELNTSEQDLAFEHSFVQLDVIQKPIGATRDKSRDSRHYETTTMTVYVKRAPCLDPRQLYWNILKAKGNLPPRPLLTPITESAPVERPTNPEPQSQHPKTKIGSKRPGGILEWMARTKGASAPADEKGLRPRLSILDKTDKQAPAEEKKPIFLEDLLDVHQKILNHLRGSARPPITSVYDMASLIADSCANVFDPYRIPDEYQFFDFFESSIGRLVSQSPH
jgi:hypothetical protein